MTYLTIKHCVLVNTAGNSRAGGHKKMLLDGAAFGMNGQYALLLH